MQERNLRKGRGAMTLVFGLASHGVKVSDCMGAPDMSE